MRPSSLAPRHPLAAGVLTTTLFLSACGGEREQAPPSAESLRAWDQIAAVLQHPRCLNCHQEESPLQGDTAQAHTPRVTRGADNLGADAMRCGNCHNQMGNNETAGVPGAPHWSLAPLSMSWAGLSSAELCRALVDPRRNGGRSAEDLLEHMEKDPLVLWGWAPGGEREAVPLPHEQMVEQMKVWTAAGMPCPQPTSGEPS